MATLLTSQPEGSLEVNTLLGLTLTIAQKLAGVERAFKKRGAHWLFTVTCIKDITLRQGLLVLMGIQIGTRINF